MSTLSTLSHAFTVLPSGRWRPLSGGQALAGGSTHTIDAPLELLPVFVRDGAILPLAEPVAGIAPDTVFQLTAEIHGDGARGCELIEDDGRTMTGLANRVHLAWDGKTVQLTRSGDWNGRRFALIGWTHRS